MVNKTSKVAFLGLDNAGKTSTLITLQKKFDFQDDIDTLKPTIKVERSAFKFLNTTISKQDFGGQEKYRMEYLKHKNRYLSGTDLIFYVIDVQDPKRFDESIEYFEAIATFFKEEEIKIPIIVLLHKFDPKLKEDKKVIRNIMDLKKKLNEWLPFHNIYFFESSIYELTSIIDAFSFGMSQLIGRKQLIDDFFESVGQKFNTVALLLFDENGVSLSEYYKSHLISEEREKIKILFTNAQKRILEKKISNIYEFSDWISYKTRVSGLISSFLVKDINFYILFIVDESNKKEDDSGNLIDKFEEYKGDLSDILEGLISNSSSTI